jgi:hypothetical protein
MSHCKSWACIKPGGDGCDGDHCADRIAQLEAENKVMEDALKKVDDPIKYHHWEQDDYTRAGCFQFVAHEALAKIEALRGVK